MKTENQMNNLTGIDKKRELYLSPQMEVFEIKVEKGFAASALGGTNSAPGWTDGGAW